ncbi:MAG: MFS transporter [Spirochaetota bacterium]
MFAHFTHHLVAALITPLLPFIRDSFAMDYTRAGMLISAFNLAYGGSQLPGGWLGGIAGFRTLITLGISGVALFGILVGLSPGFILMAVFLILMGIIGGGYHPSASPLISKAVDEKHRGKALGIHQIGGTGSFFLAPLIAAGIARVLGWRGAFISLSVPTFLYGIFFSFLLKRWGYGREYEAGKSDAGSVPEKNKIALRYIVPVLVMNVCTQTFIYSSISFVPLYVVDRLGGSKEVAAALLSLVHSAGLWAGPLGGFLSDRIGKMPIFLFVGIIAGPLIYLLNHVSFGWSISVLLLFMGMAHYMGMPVTEAYIITHSPQKHRSTVLGFYYFLSRGGPGLVAPLLGYLIDRYNFHTAFGFIAILMGVIAAVCTILILGSRSGSRS